MEKSNMSNMCEAWSFIYPNLDPPSDPPPAFWTKYKVTCLVYKAYSG